MNPLPPPVGVCNNDSTSQSPPTAVAIDISTEWLDENGHVCPKSIDYATQCPKGHLLVPLVQHACVSPPKSMCRVCHESVESQAALLWRVCSVASCCGGYAMCSSCAIELSAAPVDRSASDDFPMLVRESSRVCTEQKSLKTLNTKTCFARVERLTHHCISGHFPRVFAEAALRIRAVARAYDNVTVRKNYTAPPHFAAALQRERGAACQCCHYAPRGACDVVYQPHVEQPFCRHS